MKYFRFSHALICFVCMGFSFAGFSQVSDLGGIDYTGIFGKDDDPNFGRVRVWLNIPTKLNDREHYLVNGVRYSNAKITFNQDYGFDTSDLEEFHALEYTLGYTFPLNEKWRFTAQFSPTIASNLANKLTFDDIIYSGGIILIRTLNNEKKSRLSVGLTYNQTIGIPAPIPFVTYWREVNEHFTYTVGVPISKVKYFFNNKKSSLEAFARLDGYFANLSNDIQVNGTNAEKISLSQVVTGIGFDKYYGKRLNFFVKAGYLLRNSLRLNENISDEVFNFDLSNSFYFRGGFKFNF
ncbi:hypothetical protein GWK08_18535 [Leptobacterium flavescens]|uniref:DUF6268 domain-containing protein n=1 Tax=Leptobacterium flavescens TaxID=472055 RepID=A0A6P0UTW2_9FLAO|nr:DUF6268 family outer membrane beta-barrel protein [Leptobacterium flavescens]NER15458.1 hypothetical protein [Leptobacterium flavescens]